MEPSDRIFSYSDGARTLYADPFEIHDRLVLALGGETGINKALEEADSGHPEIAVPAWERLRNAVLFAFELGEPFNKETGQGVLRQTWWNALCAFLDFAAKKKESAGGLPTSSPPTAAASPSSDPDRSTPAVDSDCSSISTGSS